MSTSVKSFQALGTLPINIKRADDGVQVQRAGGFFKARYRGARNCVFGATREEALKRLRCFGWKKAPLFRNGADKF